MRRFFIDRHTLSSQKPTLTGPDAKHLRTVLRVQPGAEVILFDETGWQYRSKVVTITPKAVELTIRERFRSVTESPVRIAIAQALLRGRKMDRLARQLTELGISAFLPFLAQRSVSRPSGKRMAGRKDRWETIARESLKQCGRYQAPEIHLPGPLNEILDAAQAYEKKYIFHFEDNTPPPSPESPVSSIIALIGPEGGFSHEEVEQAKAHGFIPATLGPRILKADTAAIAVAISLQFTYGDLST